MNSQGGEGEEHEQKVYIEMIIDINKRTIKALYTYLKNKNHQETQYGLHEKSRAVRTESRKSETAPSRKVSKQNLGHPV